MGFVPRLGGVWYWACLVEPGGPLVTVIDHEVELPRSSSSMELRHDGLWADHVIAGAARADGLQPGGLRSFGSTIPLRCIHDPRGERVPFGFELEWETDRDAYQWPPIHAPL